MAPWSPEAKELAKFQNQCKQLLAENKKLKRLQGPKAAESMDVEEAEDGDAAVAPSSTVQRSELQAKIAKYEQTIKMYTDDGEDELVRDLQKKLEATKLQIQSLRTPATAHKQCSQKLERVQKQISTARSDMQSLQQKLEKVQKELDAKKDLLESKVAEEKVLALQVAGHAAKLSGKTEAGVEIPPDLLQLDPEDLKDDPELQQFYNAYAANPNFAKLQERCRKNVEAKLATSKVPAPPPDAEPAAAGEGTAGHPGGQAAAAEPVRADKRATSFLWDKQDVEELHRAMHQNWKEGEPLAVSPEQLGEMVTNIQNTKHRKMEGGESVKTGGG